jgi:hypothetical protein
MHIIEVKAFLPHFVILRERETAKEHFESPAGARGNKKHGEMSWNEPA